VAKFSTLCTILSIVSHDDLELHQINVVGTYLQGDLDEEIYMEVPDGIKEKGKVSWYWKLKKALYGLKQAGCQWKTRLDKAMEGLSFQKSQVDDCLYVL
jgi:Reverse transcriptase (RNA-dependent DNA polymerase)